MKKYLLVFVLLFLGAFKALSQDVYEADTVIVYENILWDIRFDFDLGLQYFIDPNTDVLTYIHKATDVPGVYKNSFGENYVLIFRNEMIVPKFNSVTINTSYYDPRR